MSVSVLLHMPYAEKSCVWVFAERVPGEILFSLIIAKDLNLFCSSWMRKVLAVLDRGNIDVPFPSQRTLVLLCCSMGRILRYQDSFVAGKAIFMLSFVICLTSQHFYTKSVKWKEKDYFVLFSQSLPGFGLKAVWDRYFCRHSICCNTGLIDYCPVIVLWRIDIKTKIRKILSSFRKTW